MDRVVGFIGNGNMGSAMIHGIYLVCEEKIDS